MASYSTSADEVIMLFGYIYNELELKWCDVNTGCDRLLILTLKLTLTIHAAIAYDVIICCAIVIEHHCDLRHLRGGEGWSAATGTCLSLYLSCVQYRPWIGSKSSVRVCSMLRCLAFGGSARTMTLTSGFEVRSRSRMWTRDHRQVIIKLSFRPRYVVDSRRTHTHIHTHVYIYIYIWICMIRVAVGHVCSKHNVLPSAAYV